MNDPVNNPAHYNQNGLEVIDVIETYAKHDFRLANVLKYVCRCEYKGKKLEDLRKARWYLERVITELEQEANPFDGIDRGVSDWSLDDLEVKPLTVEDLESAGGNYTADQVKAFFDGYDCRKQEEDDPAYSVQLPPDRIAVDDEAASRIKDRYYDFDRFAIHGYCAHCDAELPADEAYYTSPKFLYPIKFCSFLCMDKEVRGR